MNGVFHHARNESTLTAGTSVRMDFELSTGTINLRGKRWGQAGDPRPGTVHATVDSRFGVEQFDTPAGPDGEFEFVGLPEGSAVVRTVFAVGNTFRDVSRKIDLIDGEDLFLELAVDAEVAVSISLSGIPAEAEYVQLFALHGNHTLPANGVPEWFNTVQADFACQAMASAGEAVLYLPDVGEYTLIAFASDAEAFLQAAYAPLQVAEGQQHAAAKLAF